MDLKISSPAKIFTILIIAGSLFIGSGLIIFKNNNTLFNVGNNNSAGIVQGTQEEILSQIPTPPTTQVHSQTKTRKGVSMFLKADSSVSEILEFYNQKLKERGWAGYKLFHLEGGEAWNFSKETYDLEIMVVRNENERKTLITLNLKSSDT